MSGPGRRRQRSRTRERAGELSCEFASNPRHCGTNPRSKGTNPRAYTGSTVDARWTRRVIARAIVAMRAEGIACPDCGGSTLANEMRCCDPVTITVAVEYLRNSGRPVS